ncbi:16S rRNA (cytidine(1402)-2'-O)-methyltransferase [bacterium]|nr:16S rRNA (cytidine(1402)-2'-O)-methyltransferase [bacterium]
MDESIAPEIGAAEDRYTAEGGTLYLVAVPIGNLGDLSPRAKAILSQADLVACEEVQATKRLLSSQNIKAHCVSYRESGREGAGLRIVQELLAGRSVACVAGAGTPAISDPGRDLVERCHREGIKVVPVPGASALTAAISCAGLPCRRFVFEGFLPRHESERRAYLSSLAAEERTMVFYEAPHRLLASLEDMLELWGERRVFFGRELTKRFEQCWLTELTALRDHLLQTEPRGECVLVVEGCPAESVLAEDLALEQAKADLEVLEGLGLGAKASAVLLSHFRGLPRNQAKRLALDFFR